MKLQKLILKKSRIKKDTMRKSLIIVSSILMLNISCSKKEQATIIFEKELETTTTPKLFMPGVVSQRELRHFGSSFSQDGSKIVYTISDRITPSKVVTQTYVDGKFSNPELIVNDTLHSFADASISLDGNTITLTSTLPQNGEKDDNSKNGIWQFYNNANGWGNPKFIDLKMDYEGGFGYPTLTKDKTLYFAYIDTTRNMDLFYSKFKKGVYQKPIKLPNTINSNSFEGDPYIDPKERFLIFAGFNREENYGRSDLYISFKTEKGWSKAINLGKEINSHSYDGSPYVTGDDKYLIFTSGRHPEKAKKEELFNVFYVSFDIEKYKALAFK